jgi:hypothetical protein
MAISTGAAILGGAALGLGGAYLSGQAAKSAGADAANAQRYAADQAAQAQQFRPIGVTTGFGSSKFTQGPYGPTEASYTLTPELQAIRDRMLSQAGAYRPEDIGAAAQPLMGGAQGLFSLGQQYLATSPEQAAQDYLRQQRTLLAPSQEAALTKVRSGLFGSGRGGLGVQTGTGTAPSNPELQAYYNALAQQEAQLAANADLYGQQRTQFGAGLLGTGGTLLGQVPALTTAGYGPLQTQLGLAGSVEGLGQQALDIGSQLGGRTATAGQGVGQSLLQGGTAAAQSQYGPQAYSTAGAALTGLGSSITPGTTNALGTWFNNMINYGGTPQGAYGQQNAYLSSIPLSGQTQQQSLLMGQGGPDFLSFN